MNTQRNQDRATRFDGMLSRLAVATAEASDPSVDDVVGELLRAVREVLEMDVAFVSEFSSGRRVFRHVDHAPDVHALLAAGGSNPLEESFCKQVIDGRLPELVRDVARLPNLAQLPPVAFPIGAHLSTPILLADGSIYGTLCCFSFAPDEALTERDLKRLRMTAQMLGRLIDRMRSKEHGRAAPSADRFAGPHA